MKPNKLASHLVGAMIRQAIRYDEWFMLSYTQSKRTQMRQAGTFSIRGYLDGWRVAR